MSSRTPIKLCLACGTNTWTNMPAALTEFLGGTLSRMKAELTDCDKFRLNARVNTAGVAGAVIAVQYSTDETTWNTLGNGAGTIPIGTTGTKTTGWQDMPAAAMTDVFLRLAGQNGNGVADPVFGTIVLELYSITTFERIGLMEQFIANLYGLIRNWRDNATGYKLAITAGKTAAEVAAVMVADANQYLVRLQWLTDLFTRNATLGDRCLGDMGLLTSQATTLRDSLIAVANHTKAASLTTGAEVNTEADYQLANVPNYDRLW